MTLGMRLISFQTELQKVKRSMREGAEKLSLLEKWGSWPLSSLNSRLSFFSDKGTPLGFDGIGGRTKNINPDF